MTEPPNKNTVSIAGKIVDPLIEQNAQLGENDPIDPKRQAAWIVQFVKALDAETISALRTQFGVRLTDYVPPQSYIESLSPAVAALLRRDDRVRAVSLMSGDLKLSGNLRAEHESNDPTDAEPVDVVIFDALADDVLAQIRGFVPDAEFIAVLDDRIRGGAFLVRLLIRAGTAARIAEIDGVRWVEQVPKTINDDGVVADDAPDTSRIPDADRLGLTGAGQVIGIIDNGPPDGRHCFFVDPAQVDPGPEHRKIVQLRNVAQTAVGKHATFTSGIAAGDEIGNLGNNAHRGVAFGARLACGNNNDLDTSSTLLAELTAAATVGAVVHTNSFHSAPQGAGLPATYDQRSADVDVFTWTNEDHVVLGPAGTLAKNKAHRAPRRTPSASALARSAPAPGTRSVTVVPGRRLMVAENRI